MVAEASAVVAVAVVASATAVGVEVVDAVDLETAAVGEVAEAAQTVAASVTSLARRSLSRAFPLRFAHTIRFGRFKWSTGEGDKPL